MGLTGKQIFNVLLGAAAAYVAFTLYQQTVRPSLIRAINGTLGAAASVTGGNQ